jgi:hypothetical protein
MNTIYVVQALSQTLMNTISECAHQLSMASQASDGYNHFDDNGSSESLEDSGNMTRADGV